MKNLKTVVITFAFIAILGSQQSALAMHQAHQEMTLEEQLAIFDGRLAEAMGAGNYPEAHRLIEECGADITALSQEHQDEYAKYQSALASEPQLTEAMDARNYAVAHRLIERGADITALPQMYQIAYGGYLAGPHQKTEHVFHITPHPPVAAPAAEVQAGEEETGEEEKENAAPQRAGKPRTTTGSKMCTIS